MPNAVLEIRGLTKRFPSVLAVDRATLSIEPGKVHAIVGGNGAGKMCIRDSTYGMEVFGKDEMEVLNAGAEPGELRDFLASLVSYVLENDVELHDGETIGFSADDKHTITRSKGVALPDQMTLKISYVPAGDDPEEDDDDSIGMDLSLIHIYVGK